MKEQKTDCYECKHSEPVPGSCHLCCKHPANIEVLDDPLAKMYAIFASVGRVPPIIAKTKLKIKCKPFGIKMGEFNWPFIFDPVWLTGCDGFEPKSLPEKEVKE